MTNNQALGYMLLACKRKGFSEEQTKELCREMSYLFDIKTEEEAEEQGFEWYYSIKE